MVHDPGCAERNCRTFRKRGNFSSEESSRLLASCRLALAAYLGFVRLDGRADVGGGGILRVDRTYLTFHKIMKIFSSVEKTKTKRRDSVE